MAPPSGWSLVAFLAVFSVALLVALSGTASGAASGSSASSSAAPPQSQPGSSQPGSGSGLGAGAWGVGRDGAYSAAPPPRLPQLPRRPPLPPLRRLPRLPRWPPLLPSSPAASFLSSTMVCVASSTASCACAAPVTLGGAALCTMRSASTATFRPPPSPLRSRRPSRTTGSSTRCAARRTDAADTLPSATAAARRSPYQCGSPISSISISSPASIARECVASQSLTTKPLKPILVFRSRRSSSGFSHAQVCAPPSIESLL